MKQPKNAIFAAQSPADGPARTEGMPAIESNMKPLFFGYASCDSCRKARRWLEAHGIEYDLRDIVARPPRAEEIAGWLGRSDRPLARFFNTSGVRYRELGLKERIRTAADEELLALLASDGKLVRRPLLVTADRVLVGFDADEWSRRLLAAHE